MCIKVGEEVIQTKTVNEIIEERLKKLNEDLGITVDIKQKQFPIIAKVYDDLLQNNSEGTEYRKLLNRLIEIENMITEKFPEVEGIFTKYDELVVRIHEVQLLEFLISGIAIAKELETETKQEK